MLLSVDLASRRWRDNGIALLTPEGTGARVRLVSPEALGLRGTPSAAPFADALHQFAAREGVRLLLLDGPQGWRAERSTLVHLRQCEKEARCPGKTGLPGIVKPATWTRMAEFSIALFDALDALGWPRFTREWRGERAAIESFPTHAWRMLGEPPIPGKSKAGSLAHWHAALAARGVRGVPREATHDELQAVVAGLAGLALLAGGIERCDVRGGEPFLEGGHWREGVIVSARVTAPMDRRVRSNSLMLSGSPQADLRLRGAFWTVTPDP